MVSPLLQQGRRRRRVNKSVCFKITGLGIGVVFIIQVFLCSTFVFKGENTHDLLDLPRRQEISNATLKINAIPLPTVRSAQDEEVILFNPEEFRTGDKSKYFNKPNACPKCINATKQEMQIPKPVGLRHTAQNPGDSVVLSVMPGISNMNTRDYMRFVGSLRNSGYDGRIILGVHPDISQDDESYLQSMKVTLYNVALVPCQSPTIQYKANSKAIGCFQGLETLPMELGRYELARQWLHACDECTGWALLLLDGNYAFFQANPFEHLLSRSEEILFSEEIAPHTDPFYGSEQAMASASTGSADRHLTISNNPRNAGSSDKCYGSDHEHSFGPNRPVLVPSSVFATRSGMKRYLSVLVSEFYKSVNNIKNDCHYQTNDETWTMNYMYYSGFFGQPETISTMPWGTGLVQSIGKPCINHVEYPQHGQLDIVEIDYAKTGYIINKYETEDSPLRVTPVVLNLSPCDPWIQVFIKHHGEINGKSGADRSGDYLDILEHNIRQSVKAVPKISGSGNQNPMQTSYQRATVVQQAPWFPHQKYCNQTCCAQAIAISLEPDEDHLITSVDGLDLADVRIEGHAKREFMAWAISDMSTDIIPCLQPGTIFYADHEGGGVKRFFQYYRPNLTQPYLLISGSSDGGEPFGPMGLGRRMLTEDELLLNWYGINPVYKFGADLPKFQMMFLGLSGPLDHQRYLSHHLRPKNYSNPFSKEHKKRWIESKDLATATDSTRLLFVKFGINLHSQHRHLDSVSFNLTVPAPPSQAPFDMACKNRTGILMDSISCSVTGRRFQSNEIYEAAEQYLFGLSPPGNGNDCFRTYELLYLGIIPVVNYRPEYEELYEGLPVLQLEGWNFTQQQLVQKMRQYIASPSFQNNNFDGWERLFLKYWRHRVLKDTGRLSNIVDDDQGRKYYKSWTYTKYRPPYIKAFWPPKEPISEILDNL
eukprot:scaffold48918_cov59-Attheya_sp.AAC.1